MSQARSTQAANDSPGRCCFHFGGSPDLALVGDFDSIFAGVFESMSTALVALDMFMPGRRLVSFDGMIYVLQNFSTRFGLDRSSGWCHKAAREMVVTVLEAATPAPIALSGLVIG
jgi:hypothetical protein